MADRKCDLTMAWHKNEDGKCKDLNEWCPEGDLEKDMHEVAGLAITGATLLGVGVVALVSYTFNMEKPAFRNVLYASAVASLLAWVFLLAAWSHMAKITHNKYGCYFQDERGTASCSRGVSCATSPWPATPGPSASCPGPSSPSLSSPCATTPGRS
eukprot:Sspe_Gene.27965::Locus_12404_Transcript_1_1_Confidence_1.000_Length_4108::g.27965::m.27965